MLPKSSGVRVWHSPRSRALMWSLPSTPPSTKEGMWTGPEPFLLLQCLGGCVLYGAPDVLSSLTFCVNRRLPRGSKQKPGCQLPLLPAPPSLVHLLGFCCWAFWGAENKKGKGRPEQVGRQAAGQYEVRWASPERSGPSCLILHCPVSLRKDCPGGQKEGMCIFMKAQICRCWNYFSLQMSQT